MSQQSLALDTEPRLSPRPILGLMVALSFILPFVIEDKLGQADVFAPVLFNLLTLLLCTLSFLLYGWRPSVGCWATIIVCEALILLGCGWLQMPGAVALLNIPPALAVALVGLPAAVLVALSETLALTLFPQYLPVVGDASGETLLVLASIWGMVVILGALYRQLNQVSEWASNYLKLAHDLIREQRDRKAEMAQIMADLVDANRQLTQMNVLAHGLRRAADQARLAKERFVANVSHELRTPLNMIIGFSEMILEMPQTYGSGVPPALLADLSVVHRNAQHLSGLIDDVLDLSQIEARHMALTREYAQFPEIVAEALTAIRPLYESKGLYLEAHVAESLPPVLCDRTRIREVLLNLLSNAGRFTERGGVTVRAWQEGNDVVASVTDTGPGIAEKDQHKVFQPFQQLDDSIRRRHGGTGLGLNISRSFIELHGGRMWFESQAQVGATFFFRLPADTTPPAERDAASWFGPYTQYEERTRASTLAPHQLRPRVVVLDPIGALQRLLTRYLDGYEIASVGTLEEAVQDLAVKPSQAFLVNELSLGGDLEQVRSAELPYGAPMLLCSIAGATRAANSLEVSDYLVKPIAREALLGALDRLGLEGKTVLIVDDEPEALRLFRRMLASSGKNYRVLRAGDGNEALGILREQPVDAMLLDLVMPNVDGFRLLEAKNQDPALRDIPVIIISARDPAGQPIVSNGLLVKRSGGLTAQHLLACIRAVSKILSPTEPSDDPELSVGRAG